MPFLDQRGIFDCRKLFPLNHISKYIKLFYHLKIIKVNLIIHDMTPFSESLTLVIHICQHNDTLSPAWKASSSLRTKHENRLYDSHAKCYQSNSILHQLLPQCLHFSLVPQSSLSLKLLRERCGPRREAQAREEIMSALSFFSTKAVNGSGSCTQKDHSQGPPD